MTDEDAATWIGSSQGSVHAGPGSQYNWTTYVTRYGGDGDGPSRPAGPSKDPLTVAREHRAWLSQRFVPPVNFGEAADRLAEPGSTILLTGPEGIGLRTAATMLLHRLGTPDSPFEELPAGLEGDEGVAEVAPGDRFLLDLSATPDDAYREAREQLVIHQKKVADNGAWMAVVLPTGLRHHLRSELAWLTVELGRPDGLRALTRHLRRNGIRVERSNLETPELRHLLHESSMQEIFDFADLVRRARERSGRRGGFPDWCAEALAAVTKRPGEVTRQVQELEQVPERALLLSAAMFSGATADAVHHGEVELLQRLGHKDEGTPLLARPGLGERLDALGVRREEDGRVRFAQLAYDGAVRLHFWANYPDLRGVLRNWVAKAARHPGLTGSDRERLAARFAEQCLAVDRPWDLYPVAEEWTADAPRRMEAEAAVLLEQGLAHPRHAGRIRSRIYDWVTGSQLSEGLARVLTGVCRQVLAATHPDQALVRLHHLALRPKPEGDVAWDDLLDLACGSRRLHARLVDRLLTVRRGAEERKFRLLLDLLDPTRLGFCPYRQSLHDAWREVLGRSESPAVWKPSALAFFTAAHGRPDWRRAPDALIRAADGDPGVLNHLYVMTCDWAAAAPSPRDRAARQVTAAGLRQKIDAAQGLDFTTDRPGAP